MSMVVKPLLNGARDYYLQTGEVVPTMAQLMTALKSLADINKEVATGLLVVVKLLQPSSEVAGEEKALVDKPSYIG